VQPRKGQLKNFLLTGNENFAWIGFIAITLTLITGIASADLIQGYTTPFLDAIFTYGFLLLWAILDAFIIALLFTVFQYVLEWLFKRSFRVLFRWILIFGFITTWLYLVKIVLSQLK